MNEDINYCIKRHKSFLELSETTQKVLACFKEHPEIKLNTKKIIEFTNIPRRTIIHSLNILVHSLLLQKYGKGAGVKYQLTF
ncbi:MAG: hypothetical protein ACD_79C01113G0001 [uncultured bacterium]|nr:MAG: hypothetical protein ACD_79C01113G0001 [uncultured bacterium]